MTTTGGADVVETPLVTAIIIFRNAERFLVEAIASVREQSYRRWELRLVDDGSTDGSRDIAQNAAAMDPDRTIYLRHADGKTHGMSASRNLGIQNARGSFIAFLDADDVWLPYKLEEQVRVLTAQSAAAMVYGRTLLWHSWGVEGLRLGQDEIRPLAVRPNRVVEPPELLSIVLGDGPMPSNSNAMWRREIADAEPFAEQFLTTYSDVSFYVKVLREYPVAVMSQCWDRYRQHDDNAVRLARVAGEWSPDGPNPIRDRVLRWIAEYFKKVGESRTAVLDQLARAGVAARWHRVARASLVWEAKGTSDVEVRVHSLDGPLLAAGGAVGSGATGDWVRDGMVFCLCDASAGSPNARELARVTVWLSHDTETTRDGTLRIDDSPERGLDKTARLSWEARGVEMVDIREASPDGRLVARGGTRGVAIWQAPDHSVDLFLQDTTFGLPLTRDNCLSRLEWRMPPQVSRSGLLRLCVGDVRG